MKHLLFGFTLSLIIFSCSKSEHQMTLSGQVEGLKKGTLLLQKIEDTVLISVDSVQINGVSTFTFSEEIISPEVYYLYVRLKDGSLVDDRIAFFAEPKEVSIKTTLDNFGVDAIITGSENQEKLNEYKKLMQRFINKNLDLIEQNLNARQQQDDSLVLALQKQQNIVQSSKYLATVNFAINHNNYELAPYLMLSEVYDIHPKYLDTVYGSLTPKIKDSKYGKALASFILESK